MKNNKRSSIFTFARAKEILQTKINRLKMIEEADLGKHLIELGWNEAILSDNCIMYNIEDDKDTTRQINIDLSAAEVRLSNDVVYDTLEEKEDNYDFDKEVTLSLEETKALLNYLEELIQINDILENIYNQPKNL